MDDYPEAYNLSDFYEGNKLSFSSFNQCELESQVFHIMNIGTYIGTTVQREHYALYYQLNDFYACLFHNLEEDRVSHCYAFNDPDELNPLWDQLDIDPFCLSIKSS